MRDASTVTQPFSEHLSEVRSRILTIFIFFCVGSVIGYSIHPRILAFLLHPINQPLYYSSPAGGFDFTLKISLFFGCLLSIPVFVYQVLRFIDPIFSKELQKLMPIILVASCILLLSGMAFAYYVSLPAALYFLNRFSTEQILALISTNEYLNFITRYIFGFGVLFQLPLIMLVINSYKRIHTSTLIKYQKWVVLSSFVIAAILTPTPDLFNQLVMAVPLILLYEISFAVLLIVNKRKNPST